MSRTVVPVVLLVASALAGCVVEPPVGVQEGEHREAPVADVGDQNLTARGIDATWTNPSTNATKEFHWPTTRARLDGGVHVVETAHLSLRYRVDEPIPVRLRFDEDLSLTNTFNLSYVEPASATGRVVTRVADVADESHLDFRTFDPVTGRVSGTFRLVFNGTCDAADDGCDAPGAPVPVVLVGQFPPRTH